MKRIAFISNSGGMGGAEKCLLDQIAVISGAYDPLVFIPTYGELSDYLTDKRIPFLVTYHTPWTYHKSLLWPASWLISQLWYPLKLAFMMWRRRVDIVYTNTMITGGGLFAAWLLRKPHICHVHESGLDYMPYRFLFGEPLTLWLINRCSQKIIVVSEFLKKRFKPMWDIEKVSVIYNYIEVDPLVDGPVPPPENGPWRLCMVGHMYELKRQEDAVLAVAQLKKRGIPVVLDLIGDALPEYREYLMKLIIQHGVVNEIRWRGSFKTALPIIAESNIVLVCSEIEGLSRVAIEAMALGKLVIATDRGALPELVRHGETGLLFPCRDVNALVERIVWVTTHRQEWNQLQRNAYQWVSQMLSQERYQSELLEVINNV